jgi:hypothetical protein
VRPVTCIPGLSRSRRSSESHHRARHDRAAGWLIALIADSAHALEILVVITAFLWLTGTIWHVLTIGSEP